MKLKESEKSGKNKCKFFIMLITLLMVGCNRVHNKIELNLFFFLICCLSLNLARYFPGTIKFAFKTLGGPWIYKLVTMRKLKTWVGHVDGPTLMMIFINPTNLV